MTTASNPPVLQIIPSLRTTVVKAYLGIILLVILFSSRALAHTDVTAQQARDLIDSTPDLIVLDVREPYEYCSTRGHIPGALNYPWSSGVLEVGFAELPTDRPILVVCASGGRSNSAATFLDSNGFSQVYDMMGGMSAWQWETAPCKYSGGSGTPDDPYQIATAADLIALGETPEDYDKHFILTADIDLDPNLPGGKVFEKAVIAATGAFLGSFDGDGHTISHLTIKGAGHLGLFGTLAGAAEVRGVGLMDVRITGSAYTVGALVARNHGAVTQCYSTGVVNGTHDVGGLVGDNTAGSIANCYSSGSVSGDTSIGGLVGYNIGSITESSSIGSVSGSSFIGGLAGGNDHNGSHNGSIANCYSSGSVSGTGSDVGGLVSINVGRITSSYSIGSVTGESRVGGLIGRNLGEVTNCCSLSTVAGNSTIGGLVGVNFEESFRGDGIIAGLVAKCYSTGEVSGTENVGGLVGVNKFYFRGLRESTAIVDDSFWNTEMSGQITSDGGTGKTTAEMQTTSTFHNAGWDFVGETENGPNDVWKIVEGQTYPLLSWQKYGGGTGEPNYPYLIYTAEHLNALGTEPNDYDKHFKLMADIDLSGYSYDRAVIAPDVGGDGYTFPGNAFTGVFDGNGYAVLNMTITGKSYLGLFGRIGPGGQIEGLGVVDVDIKGSYYAIGGLVGDNFRGSITACYSTGKITGYTHVGGLVGYNQYGDIAACYSTCAVSATFSGNQAIGGFAGVNAGRITTSYSSGAVSGQRQVGGFVGRTTDFISMCYSTGTVSGDQQIGGLVGERPMDYGVVIDCFWDIQSSALVSSKGGTGKTTAEMQTANTFLEAGWDFIDETINGTDDIWWILEGQDYPRLWWEDR